VANKKTVRLKPAWNPPILSWTPALGALTGGLYGGAAATYDGDLEMWWQFENISVPPGTCDAGTKSAARTG